MISLLSTEKKTIFGADNRGPQFLFLEHFMKDEARTLI
jgi:hypothetical protein